MGKEIANSPEASLASVVATRRLKRRQRERRSSGISPEIKNVAEADVVLQAEGKTEIFGNARRPGLPGSQAEDMRSKQIPRNLGEPKTNGGNIVFFSFVQLSQGQPKRG
jgi:hypothetical protein